MNEIQIKRRTARWQYRCRLRRENAVSQYLRVAAPQLHKEAEQFFNNIQHLYPAKKDLTKTKEFKEFVKSTAEKGSKSTPSHIHVSNKQMVLNIELSTSNEMATQIQKSTTSIQDGPVDTEITETMFTSIRNESERDKLNAAATSSNQDGPVHTELSEIITTSILNDSEWDKLNATFQEIPHHTMEQMLNEINNDPDLKEILDLVNVDDDDDLLDIDINIDSETDLEKELNKIFS